MGQFALNIVSQILYVIHGFFVQTELLVRSSYNVCIMMKGFITIRAQNMIKGYIII